MGVGESDFRGPGRVDCEAGTCDGPSPARQAYFRAGEGKLWPAGQIQPSACFINSYWDTACPFVCVEYAMVDGLQQRLCGLQRKVL